MDKIAEAFVDNINLDGLLFTDSCRNFLAAPRLFGFRFGLLATTVFPLFFALKGSFPERLPRESIAVVSALTIYTLGGLVVSLLKANVGFYLILWVIFLVVLILASAHARRRKPPISLEDPPNW